MASGKIRIAIVGTGAVGGYFGGLLQRTGHDLHFLLRSDYDHVRRHGLVIESVRGDFSLPSVAAYDSARSMPRCDLVIVTLKTTSNRQLSDMLPHVLADGGTVLTLQNGLGSEETIAECIGRGHILGGLCFLCTNKVGPGRIRHLDYGIITMGEYRDDHRPAGITARVEAIAAILRSAEICVHPIEDLWHARWKKLVWNIPFNGMTVIHNTLTDQLLRDPETRRRCRVLMEEAAAASAVCARPIETAFLDKMMADTESMQPYAPSMKLDFDHGRPLEIESIYGVPLRMAQAAGVAMPETAELYRQLREIAPAGTFNTR